MIRSSLLIILIFLSFFTINCFGKCCIDNYDFTSIGTGPDYFGFQDDYSEIYYLRLCNTVLNLWCQLNSNTVNSMACQVSGGDPSSTFNIATNDSSALTWSYVRPGTPTAGVKFHASTGDRCPNNQHRVLAGQIMCGNTTGTLLPVVENPMCTYNMNLYSPLICSEGQVEENAEEHSKIAEKQKEMHKKFMKERENKKIKLLN